MRDERPVDTPAILSNQGSERRAFLFVTRLSKHSEFLDVFDSEAPYGYFGGRPIIGESNRIHGGVFPGVFGGEATVVDESYGVLAPLYSELLISYVKKHGKGTPKEQLLLEHLNEFVQKRLELRPEQVPPLNAHKKIGNDTKVALDMYIRAGYGAERHQILFTAYLMEKLIERKVLHGSVFLDLRVDDSGNETMRLIFMNEQGTLLAFEPTRTRVSKKFHECLPSEPDQGLPGSYPRPNNPSFSD